MGEGAICALSSCSSGPVSESCTHQVERWGLIWLTGKRELFAYAMLLWGWLVALPLDSLAILISMQVPVFELWVIWAMSGLKERSQVHELRGCTYCVLSYAFWPSFMAAVTHFMRMPACWANIAFKLTDHSDFIFILGIVLSIVVKISFMEETAPVIKGFKSFRKLADHVNYNLHTACYVYLLILTFENSVIVMGKQNSWSQKWVIVVLFCKQLKFIHTNTNPLLSWDYFKVSV